MESSPDQTIQDWIGYQPEPQRYEYTPDNPPEVASHILALIKPQSRILDVGCGTGALADLLRHRCEAEVVGVEPNAQRAEMTRERGIEVETGYLSLDMREKLGEFDVVIFADVLEHCANPGDVIRLAKQFLKPDGVFVISVPNVAHWSIRAELLWGNFDYEEQGILDATHLRWFTRKSLQNLFKNLNCEIDELRYCANTGLPAYRTSLFFRFLPDRIMKLIVRYGIRFLPTWFACQLVARIRLVNS